MLVERAEHDQLSVGESRIGFDLAGDRQTVHPRHQEIQKHKLDRRAGRNSLSHFFEGLNAAAGALHCHLPSGQQMAQDRAVGGAVIHDERANPGQSAVHRIGLECRGKLFGKSNGEPERGTLAGCAHDPNLAAHQLDQFARNGQSQTGAAKPAGD